MRETEISNRQQPHTSLQKAKKRKALQTKKPRMLQTKRMHCKQKSKNRCQLQEQKNSHHERYGLVSAKIRYFLGFKFAFDLLCPQFYVRVLPCDTVVSWCEIWIPNFKYELAFDLLCLRFNNRVSQWGIQFSKILQLLFAVFPFYFPAVPSFGCNGFLFCLQPTSLFCLQRSIFVCSDPYFFLQRVPCGQSCIWIYGLVLCANICVFA